MKNVFITVITVGVCFWGGVLSAQEKERTAGNKQPNILIYFTDDVGWGDLGCYSNPFYETPNLDAFRKSGMKFTNAYANGANCAPSRSALLTGMSTARTGCYTVGDVTRFDNDSEDIIKSTERKLFAAPNQEHPDGTEYTFAKYLKDAGYATGWFGKRHYMPQDRDFIKEMGCDDVHLFYRARHFKFKTQPAPKEVLEDDVYLSDYMADRAISFMNSAVRDGKPFMCYVPDYLAHVPLQAKKDLLAKYNEKPKHKDYNNAKYAAMIEAMDHTFGRLLQCLKDNGVENDTLVIFTSDNGGWSKLDGSVAITSNLPLRGTKGTFNEGGIRVPMLAGWHGKIKPGSTSDEPVQLTDLFTTFIDIEGKGLPSEVTEKLEGTSLLPLFQNPESKLTRDAIYWHFPGYLPGRTRPLSVVRSGNYKLFENFEDGSLELYNLETDIGEKNNLAGEKPELTHTLHKKLRAWQKKVNAPMPEKNPNFDERLEGRWTHPKN